MAKVHKTIRMDTELAARVAAWADERGTSFTEAIQALITLALDESSTRAATGPQEPPQRPTADAELRELYGEHIRDLRAHIATLVSQVAEKDKQLAQAQELAARSQALEAAHIERGLSEAQRDGFRNRLARWIAGTGKTEV